MQPKSSKNRWSRQCLLNYILIQIPFALLFLFLLLILQDWLEFKTWLVWAALTVWVLKDTVLFFFLWPAYETDNGEGRYSLIGKIGTAKSRIDPDGLVFVLGEYWRAELGPGEPAIATGQKVQVWDRQGLVLVIGKPQSARND
ncbi:MAG: NfeD family protein [Desulfohalobiaceae bacterium]